MNTRFVMIASSVFTGLMGLALTFMPGEVLNIAGPAPQPILLLMLQLTGALYFGFAMTNWMAKAVLIGGIYARPLGIGNFSYFLIAGLALLKASFKDSIAGGYVMVLAIIYLLFAISFGYIVFRNPSSKHRS